MTSAGVDIDRILHFAFYDKHSEFTDNIGSGNFTFCQNPPISPTHPRSARPCLSKEVWKQANKVTEQNKQELKIGEELEF